MVKTKHLPYYEIIGTYREVGEFLGSNFRQSIQESIAKRKKNIQNYDSYLSKSQQCFEITKQYFPNLIIETEGIARGADVPVLDYFFINNREVYDEAEAYDRKHAVNPDHCTVVAGFDMNNATLTVGHNEDWSKDAQDQIYILKATIGETTFIGLNYNVTVPGVSASINNYGLIQCVNDLYQNNTKIGVPKNYIARAILELNMLDQAEKLIRNTPRASGFNHVLAENREVRNIEIAGDVVGVGSVHKKPYVHTNHYLVGSMQEFEKFHTKSSEERYKRAKELLKPAMTKEDVIAILSDTQNTEYPICRAEETIASAVFSGFGTQFKAYFCYGHPCQGEFVEYKFKET